MYVYVDTNCISTAKKVKINIGKHISITLVITKTIET